MADRVAVVVGGASGIGAACARALADHGCTVVVADLGEGADVVCDVTSEEAVTALFDGVVAAHGRVDVVVREGRSIDFIRGAGIEENSFESESASGLD